MIPQRRYQLSFQSQEFLISNLSFWGSQNQTLDFQIIVNTDHFGENLLQRLCMCSPMENLSTVWILFSRAEMTIKNRVTLGVKTESACKDDSSTAGTSMKVIYCRDLKTATPTASSKTVKAVNSRIKKQLDSYQLPPLQKRHTRTLGSS